MGTFLLRCWIVNRLRCQKRKLRCSRQIYKIRRCSTKEHVNHEYVIHSFIHHLLGILTLLPRNIKFVIRLFFWGKRLDNVKSNKTSHIFCVNNIIENTFLGFILKIYQTPISILNRMEMDLSSFIYF